MDKSIEKYFIGKMTKEEKLELLCRIQKDQVLKGEFIRMPNSHAYLNSLLAVNDEENLSELKLDETFKIIRKRHLLQTFRNFVKYAAVIALMIVNGWLLYDKFSTEQPEETLLTNIEVPCGQRTHLVLPDKTEVWLSSRSILRIPNDFRKGKRSVELDGGGFFNVSKDKSSPFIVKTHSYDVKVLGTKFNLFAYSENKSFETCLIEGSVQVINSSEPKENYLLNPNEKVVLQNGSLVKYRDVFHNEQNLKDGIFAFDNKTFSLILYYMQVWFDVSFDIAPNVEANQIVSGKLKQYDDIEHVLKALQDVTHFKYKKEKGSNRILIYK